MADKTKDTSATEAWQKPFEQAGAAMKAGRDRAAKASETVNLKVIEHAEANAHEAFQALRAAASASSLQEVMEIQRKFIAEQSSRGMDQVREFGELIARFGREAFNVAKDETPAKKDAKS